LKITVTAIL